MPSLRIVHEDSSPMPMAHDPVWMRRVLLAAGAYNLLWGGLAIAFPGLFFRILNLPAMNYPAIWQCVGMIVGVYGVGYLIAAFAPIRHWPIILVGLLGKILGPIGFVHAAATGAMPWSFGWTIVTNDLIWWVPFGVILLAAYQAWVEEKQVVRLRFDAAIETYRTQRGVSLSDLSRDTPVLVVFLRHTGCTFCREALSDVWRSLTKIEAQGARVCLVHMDTDDHAADVFSKYYLYDIDRISDPDRRLYRAFGLQRGGLRQLFGFRVWRRGFDAMFRGGHGVGALVRDGFQMPGAFLLQDGEIVRSFVHQTAGDRPDYAALAQCEVRHAPKISQPAT